MRAPIGPGSEARGLGFDALLGLVVAAGLCGPAILRGELVGSAKAEVYGHAWVHWWAQSAWPGRASGTELALRTESWPVIDPLPTWIAAGMAHLGGATAGWNSWAVLGVVLAAVGGGALARATGGVGHFGALALPLSAISLGSLQSGLTEDGGVGVVALALAAMLRGRPVLGGLLLAASAAFGLYLAWLGGLAALGIGLWRLGVAARASRLRTELGPWLLGGTLALALGYQVVKPFALRLEEGIVGRAPVREEPLWRLNPWLGADLASYFVPGDQSTDATIIREHPAYLGWASLGLAASGGWHPALLGLGVALMVAPGEQLSVMGRPTGWTNPVYSLFLELPYADRLRHAARVLLVGQLALLVLAARGARQLPVLGSVLLVAEVIVFSPATTPISGTPTASPPIYAVLAGLAEGPIVVLPATGPGVHPQKVFYDQRAHGRPVLHDPNRPEPRPPVGLARWMVVLQRPWPEDRGAPVVASGDAAVFEGGD